MDVLYACSHVCMCICVCLCICPHSPRLTSFFTLHIEAGSPTEHGSSISTSLGSQFALGNPCLCLSCAGIMESPHTNPFDVGSGDLNSMPHANQ